MTDQQSQIRLADGRKVSFTWDAETGIWRTWKGTRANVTEGQATDLDSARDAVRAVHDPPAAVR
jgi:hypothetical protein